jgi:hemolysin D
MPNHGNGEQKPQTTPPLLPLETPRKGQAKGFLSTRTQVFRERWRERRDYEFLPATLEVLERPPAPFMRATVLLIISLAAAAIAWASLSNIDIVVNAGGQVIPKDKVKVLQPFEAGIVTAIHVRDGENVRRGDLLVSMNNTENLADIASLTHEITTTTLTLLRLEAELQHDLTLFTPPADAETEAISLHRRLLVQSVAAHQERLTTLDREIERSRAEAETNQVNLRRLEETLPLVQELYNKKHALAQRKLLSESELLQAQLELTSTTHNLAAAKSQAQESITKLKRSSEEKRLTETVYRRDLLSQATEARSNHQNLQQQLTKGLNKRSQFELRAPVDGIVQQLAINTVGGVVTPAQPLLVIVPTEGGLIIEAKVLNKDIGFVAQAQDVSVKVAAYPFTQYGDLSGTIDWVASDAVVDQELGPYYPIRVAVSDYRLPNIINGRRGVLNPGMAVTADIKVGKRKVIEYFLGPIMRYKDQSLREM